MSTSDGTPLRPKKARFCATSFSAPSRCMRTKMVGGKPGHSRSPLLSEASKSVGVAASAGGGGGGNRGWLVGWVGGLGGWALLSEASEAKGASAVRWQPCHRAAGRRLY